MKVAIELEGRSKVLVLQDGTLESLKKSCHEMFQKDIILKKRLLTHEPSFYSYNGEFEREMEIEETDNIVHLQKIRVQFNRIDLPINVSRPHHADLFKNLNSCD